MSIVALKIFKRIPSPSLVLVVKSLLLLVKVIGVRLKLEPCCLRIGMIARLINDSPRILCLGIIDQILFIVLH